MRSWKRDFKAFFKYWLKQERKKMAKVLRMKVKKLEDENRGDMLGDIENLHKIGKADAYIHVINQMDNYLK